jgi:hypothetical protein
MYKLVAVVCPVAVAVISMRCGQQNSVTRLEATRDQCAMYLAATACDRYDDCQGYNHDRVFRTREACENDYKNRALRLWPAELCATGNIDQDRFELCLEKLMIERCTKDFWDAVTSVRECQPHVVCTASPSATPGEQPEPVATN